MILDCHRCGRIIEKERYKLYLRRNDGLKGTDMPRFPSELCEFVHCFRWMACCILDFSRRITKLNDVLEKDYSMRSKHTKKSVKHLRLDSLGCTEEHTECYRSIQDSLREAVRQSYTKNKLCNLCIYRRIIHVLVCNSDTEKTWTAQITNGAAAA